MDARLRSRDREVAERLLEEAQDLVLPLFRNDPVGVLFDMLDEGLLVLAHLEEVVGLLHAIDAPAAVRAGIVRAQVLLRPEPLLVDAVPSRVGRFVDLAAVP